MGRHRAEPKGRRRGQRAEKRTAGSPRSSELLGWGIFISGTTAACLLWAEATVSMAAGFSGLLLAAFTAAWYASRGTAPQPHTTPAANELKFPKTPEAFKAAEPAKTPVDAKKVPDSPLPAVPLAPGAARDFLSTPVPGPSGQASRWTRTFGPPDTGSLPLQPYVPGSHQPVKTADSEQHDRRQRSHSSL